MNAWTDNTNVVCVDFNGVLDKYDGSGSDESKQPRMGARAFLSGLKRCGYRVVVMTACDPQKVKEWLMEHDMAQFVELVTNEKVPAIAYVDDRAVPFTGDFDKTFDAILTFQCYWEDENHKETLACKPIATA